MTGTGTELADRLAVEDVVVAYAQAMDGLDWPLMRALFTPAATTTMDGVGEFGGRDELVDFYAERLPVFAVVQHFVSNFVIRTTGDRATARNHFVSYHVPKDGPPYTHGGTFEFDLVCEGGTWLISTQAIRLLWSAGSVQSARRS